MTPLRLQDLRSELETVLASGMAEAPIEHATQVAEVASLDVVIEKSRGRQKRRDEIFEGLGFQSVA